MLHKQERNGILFYLGNYKKQVLFYQNREISYVHASNDKKNQASGKL